MKPALQGALGGQIRAGVAAAEEDADQPAPPAGVLTAQGEGLVAEGVMGRGARATAGGVRRLQGVPALIAEPMEQVSNGARRQSQVTGDVGDGLVAAGALPDNPAQG